MVKQTYAFVTPLWVHPGEGGWHFLTVPPDISTEITELTVGTRTSFGSVRVTATVRGTAWRTSIFPDGGTGTYLLPVKKSVRQTEGADAGDTVCVELTVVSRA